MKETLNLVAKVVGWIALFAAFASLGFATDNPKVGVPAYLVFFLVVFGVVYLILSKKKDDVDEAVSENTKVVVHKVIGVVLTLFAIIVPDIVLGSYKFPVGIYAMISGISLVLIVLGSLTVKLINSNFDKNVGMVILGYIIFIILSAVPALAMLRYDSSYNALGLAYWSAVALTIFAWWGLSLFSSHGAEESEE